MTATPDMLFEGARALISCGLLGYLLYVGHQGPISSEPGWYQVLSGFGLLTAATLLDLTDNFPQLDHWQVVGDTPLQAFLEKVVGYLGGTLLLCIGFSRWLPVVVAGRRSERLLVALRDQLEERVSERTAQLRSANRCMEAELSLRQQREAELRVSEQKYRLIFEQIQDVYYEVCLDGLLLEVSPSVTALSGYEREEVIGTSMWQYYLDTAERQQFISALMAEGRVADYEIHLRDKDGTVRPCAVSAQVLHDRQGNPEKICGSLRDLRDRQVAEQQRARAQKAESLGLMAGGLAHNLNNLLSVILGSAELLEQELPREGEERRWVAGIRDAARQAARIGDGMVEFAGRGRCSKDLVELNEVVAAACAAVRPSMAASQRMIITREAGLPPVDADRSQLAKAAELVLNNAVEAVDDEAGVISVATGWGGWHTCVPPEAVVAGDPPGGDAVYAYVEISDNGCGISSAQAQQVFDPFYTTHFTGRGLGLSVASGILRAHGGAIAVSGLGSAGTRVRMLVPATSREGVADPEAAAVEEAGDGPAV